MDCEQRTWASQEENGKAGEEGKRLNNMKQL